jgi:acyl-coenzyme A thioesterase PaaI-like protein
MSPAPAERRLLPWSRSCFVCGEANPRGLRARCYRAGDTVELPFRAEADLAGWSAVIHGGLIATVLDEVMTWAAILGSRRACFAAELGVRLVKPLAPGSSCLAVGRLRSGRRRVFDTEAWLSDASGAVYARGTGRYMPVSVGQLGASRHDFVEGDGSLRLVEILDSF